jgi:hypothetical protein
MNRVADALNATSGDCHVGEALVRSVDAEAARRFWWWLGGYGTRKPAPTEYAVLTNNLRGMLCGPKISCEFCWWDKGLVVFGLHPLSGTVYRLSRAALASMPDIPVNPDIQVDEDAIRWVASYEYTTHVS